MENHIDAFTKIYTKCSWGNNKNLNYLGSSGCGSTPEYNKDYIPFIIKFINDYNITKVVDLGCGDWESSYLIYDNIKSINYIGYDAYKDIILNNTNNHPRYNFIHLDILNNIDNIENTELYILKDILQHWTNKEIVYFLDKLISIKKYKHILIINSANQKFDNQDTTSTFRHRSLSVKYNPLKQYKPKLVFTYHEKEVLLISKD